jgi:hypothetical protein
LQSQSNHLDSLIIKVQQPTINFSLNPARHSTYQESSFMGISKLFYSIAQYLSEAVVRIFSPTDDAYPDSGVQPFSGQPFNKNKRANW